MTPKELGQKLIDGEAEIAASHAREDSFCVVIKPPPPKLTRGEEIAEKLIAVAGSATIGFPGTDSVIGEWWMLHGSNTAHAAVACFRRHFASAIDAAIAEERYEINNIVDDVIRGAEAAGCKPCVNSLHILKDRLRARGNK